MELNYTSVGSFFSQALSLSHQTNDWVLFSALIAGFVSVQFWKNVSHLLLLLSLSLLIWSNSPAQISIGIATVCWGFLGSTRLGWQGLFMALGTVSSLSFLVFSNPGAELLAVLTTLFLAVALLPSFTDFQNKEDTASSGLLLMGALLLVKFPEVFSTTVELPEYYTYLLLIFMAIRVLYRGSQESVALIFLALTVSLPVMGYFSAWLVLASLFRFEGAAAPFAQTFFWGFVTFFVFGFVPLEDPLIQAGAVIFSTRVWLELWPKIKYLKLEIPEWSAGLFLASFGLWAYLVVLPAWQWTPYLLLNFVAVLLGYFLHRFSLSLGRPSINKSPRALGGTRVSVAFGGARAAIGQRLLVATGLVTQEFDRALAAFSSLSRVLYQLSPLSISWIALVLLVLFIVQGALP